MASESLLEVPEKWRRRPGMTIASGNSVPSRYLHLGENILHYCLLKHELSIYYHMRIKYARTVCFSNTFYLNDGTFKMHNFNSSLVKLIKKIYINILVT